jgi:hypothetical protein
MDFAEKYLIAAQDMPASFGEHGPGEIMSFSRSIDEKSLSLISVLRTISGETPSSPRY